MFLRCDNFMKLWGSDLPAPGALPMCVYPSIYATARRKSSAMLWQVGKLLSLLIAVLAAACFLAPLNAAQPLPPALPPAAAVQQAPAQPSSAPQFPPPASQPNATPGSPSPLASAPVIVLDPAHGGTNTGARGEKGLVEKDLVLQIARTLQAQLQNHGYRVVMTRTDDSNPSYDDRAAIANAYHTAIFITLHVGSTGKIGTVRAFYDQFWTPIPAVPSSAPAPAPNAKTGSNSKPGPAAVSPIAASAKAPPNTLISWQEAQRPYVDASHRLANLLQLQFAQTFSGSPLTPAAVPLRDLRSVAEPAIAIEIANVSAPSANVLLALTGPLSLDIERAVDTFQQSGAARMP
jgi:N-acetylmuramoyl-L-alanine amidase